MKFILLAILFSSLMNTALTQNIVPKKTSSSGIINIDVPNFANPALKQFYEELTYNIKKTVTAIRNKDEAALRNLYKESEKMREKENQIMANAKHSPEDIKKKREWNRQVMPYYQEMHESDFFNKLEQKQR